MKCIFCHSSNVRKASYPRATRFNNKVFGYKECRDCRLVFIDPLPAREDYARMYAGSYHNEFYFKDVEPDHSAWFGLLEKYGGQKDLLDYGCGDASFLKYFQKRGYACTGVEFDPQLVDRLRKENPGIRFYTTEEFWMLDPTHRFHALFMGDVLEHIDTPADFLQKLMTRVASGGLIAAQGPLENNTSLALSVRKTISRVKSVVGSKEASHVPYHISFSNAANQQYVFERAGLTTRHYQVIEAAWPFPSQFSASPAKSLLHLVARTSMALSRSLPGKMGNRFLYVGQKSK